MQISKLTNGSKVKTVVRLGVGLRGWRRVLSKRKQKVGDLRKRKNFTQNLDIWEKRQKEQKKILEMYQLNQF